jgi:hypothetical protein
MGAHQELLRGLSLSAREPRMNKAKQQVRELAAWGLHDDEYRPAMYRGNPGRASELVVARPSFSAPPALVHVGDYGLEARLAAQRAREDLQTEMKGLDWSIGVADLRFLLAFQRRLVTDSAERRPSLSSTDEWESLVHLSFGEPAEVVADALQENVSLTIRSINPNLSFRFTEGISSPLSIHSGSPFFEVAEYRGRWFLRDGYHRAFQCLRSGIYRLPAVIVRARTLAELGAVQPWFFSEDVLFSTTPPFVTDFLDDALVIEYERSPLIKTLRITVEETYTFQEGNS